MSRAVSPIVEPVGPEVDPINECETGEAQCHMDAVCIDTDEAYVCQCNEGFVENGYSCFGIIILY